MKLITTTALAALTLVLGATPGNAQQSYGYDALGRLTRATWPDGTTILYTYDARGNVTGRDVVSEPPPFTYCQAKVNSCGTLPAIASSGTPSATAGSGFVVTASDAAAQKLGVWLYTNAGPAQPALPFSGGLLCLSFPVRRGPVVVSTGTPGACDGQFALDVNAFAQGLAGGNPAAFLQTAGTTVNCQWWGRDTQAGGPLLSDALEYVTQP